MRITEPLYIIPIYPLIKVKHVANRNNFDLFLKLILQKINIVSVEIQEI